MSEMNVHQRFAKLWAWILVIVFSLAIIAVIIYFATQPNPKPSYPPTRDTTTVNRGSGGGS